MKIPHNGERAFATDVVRFWFAENAKVLLLLLGLTAFAIVAGSFLTNHYSPPGVVEEGELVRFGAHGDYDGDHLLIVVRTQEGGLRTIGANPDDVFYCHPGSRIRLVRHGSVLAVQGRACARGNG